MPVNNCFPEPSELWDNYLTTEGIFLEGSGWSEDSINKFHLQISGIANSIIYAEQSIINRVVPQIKDIITKIKTKEISEEEGIKLVHAKVVFSKVELENIREEYNNDGGMLESFYENRGLIHQ
jgi:hypothetical protein